MEAYDCVGCDAVLSMTGTRGCLLVMLNEVKHPFAMLRAGSSLKREASLYREGFFASLRMTKCAIFEVAS